MAFGINRWFTNSSVVTCADFDMASFTSSIGLPKRPVVTHIIGNIIMHQGERLAALPYTHLPLRAILHIPHLLPGLHLLLLPLILR